VIWKGNQYQAYPIAVEGSSQRTKAHMPARQWRWRTLPVY
jgi:phage-related protein